MKNLPASAGDARDLGSILRSGIFLEKEMASYSSVLAWKILWTEEPGGLQSVGLQSRTSEHACAPAPRFKGERSHVNGDMDRLYHELLLDEILSLLGRAKGKGHRERLFRR